MIEDRRMLRRVTFSDLREHDEFIDVQIRHSGNIDALPEGAVSATPWSFGGMPGKPVDTSAAAIAEKLVAWLSDQKYGQENILHAVVCCDFVSRCRFVNAIAGKLDEFAAVQASVNDRGLSKSERIADVVKLIEEADDALVELNLGNYTDDDVQQAQNGMLEASAILRSILASEKGST